MKVGRCREKAELRDQQRGVQQSLDLSACHSTLFPPGTTTSPPEAPNSTGADGTLGMKLFFLCDYFVSRSHT